MEEDILNYSPTVKFIGPPVIVNEYNCIKKLD